MSSPSSVQNPSPKKSLTLSTATAVIKFTSLFCLFKSQHVTGYKQLTDPGGREGNWWLNYFLGHRRELGLMLWRTLGLEQDQVKRTVINVLMLYKGILWKPFLAHKDRRHYPKLNILILLYSVSVLVCWLMTHKRQGSVMMNEPGWDPSH